MRFDSGKLHVCERGSFRPLGRIQSQEILALRSDYAYDVEGIAPLLYRAVTSPENGDTPYEAPGREYRACAGEESSLSFLDVSVFRSIQSTAEDYARGGRRLLLVGRGEQSLFAGYTIDALAI